MGNVSSRSVPCLTCPMLGCLHCPGIKSDEAWALLKHQDRYSVLTYMDRFGLGLAGGLN